ncbi:MAG: hypothetical protein ABI721_02815 [Candidatus Dojkabacteria bacterium]
MNSSMGDLAEGDRRRPVETTTTLAKRIKIIDDLINAVILNLEISQTAEIDSHVFLTHINTLMIFYTSLFNQMKLGSFDFDPDLYRLNGLINHDLRKPVNIIQQFTDLAFMPGFEHEFHTILRNNLGGLVKSFKYMKSAIRIMDNINRSNSKEIPVTLTLNLLVDLLNLSPSEHSNLFSIIREEELLLHFYASMEASLGVEEFFTVNTLLLNLIDTNATKGVVTIEELHGSRIITIHDDACFEGKLIWPPHILKKYEDYYFAGHLYPFHALRGNSNGLGLVHILAGQRPSKNLLNLDEPPFLFCVDGSTEDGTMKYIQLVYPEPIRPIMEF